MNNLDKTIRLIIAGIIFFIFGFFAKVGCGSLDLCHYLQDIMDIVLFINL